MAADQRKKHLSNASVTSSFKTKKKKTRLPQIDVNVRSNISLEWDDKKRSVVSKCNQIGITWRDLRPFHDYAPSAHNILADVLDVPYEIFELENLREVLSYEVWQSHLSEDERNHLQQFLPEGADSCHVIQELLAGSNLHFGSPFMNWGASLCSGKLHPDAVLHRDKLIKEGKKAYYPELQKYHNEMVGNLLTWKERWAACKDPETEIVHKIWRSKEKRKISITDANESRPNDATEDLEPTSDSGSGAGDDKMGSSDNQDKLRKPRELQKRKMAKEDKDDTIPSGPKGAARPRKGENLRKQNIQCGDGSKYMSYIKVSREQHQRLKSSMKHSSNTIQSKALTRVLGEHYASQVKPFEHFEEEERKKLQRHWLQLAARDIPLAYANWRKWQLEKRKIAQYLVQEMAEKLNIIEEDEKEESAPYMPADHLNIREEYVEVESSGEVEESANSGGSCQEQMDDGMEDRVIDQEVGVEENSDSEVEEISDEEAAAEDEPMIDLSVSTQNHLQQIQSLGSSHAMSSMHVGPDEYPDTHPTLIEYPEISNGHMTGADIAASQGAHLLSSSGGVWVPVSKQDSYYHSTSFNHDQYLANELPLQHLQGFRAPPVSREEEIRKNLLGRQSMDGPLFNQYGNQGQNELLQQMFTGQEGLPYHHEPRRSQLDFLPSTVSGYFGGQLHPSLPLPLDSRTKGLELDDVLMQQQNGQAKMFTGGGGRYTTPSFDVQNWAVNPMNLPTPLQSHHVNGSESGPVWLPAEPRVRGGVSGWPGLDGLVRPGQTIGTRSNVVPPQNVDQSLFSALSQCNDLRPVGPSGYGSVGPAQPTSYSGPVPAVSNMFQQTVNPLNYLSGHEAPVSVKNNGIPWMTMPSNLQDSLGKPFLKPWNS